MPTELSRRSFAFIAVPAAGMGVLGLPRIVLGEPDAAKSATPDALTLFPRQPLSLAEKVVGLAHRDLKGVKELVEAHPALANAAHDWGFGDWESAIGAASHTGRIEIAEYLLSKGARPDVFTFAMLGNLIAVKAVVEAMPGAQRLRGPHGISLLSHARAGGEKAKPVADYLESLGDADPAYTDLPITEAIKRALLGVYTYGPGDTERLEVGEGMGGLTIKRTGRTARRLFQQSPTEFHPSGAPAVRIRFEIAGEAAGTLTITDHDQIVAARRTK